MLPNFGRERARRCCGVPIPTTRQLRGKRLWVLACALFSVLYIGFFVSKLIPSSPRAKLDDFADMDMVPSPGSSNAKAPAISPSSSPSPSPSPTPSPPPPPPFDPYSVKIPYVTSTLESTPELTDKRLQIRDAFKHAYHGYEKQCLGNGEVKPVSGKCKNWLADKMGLTIIDSLDTMLIMGLHDEYKRGVDYLRQHLDWDKNISVLVFEMNIRCLGGLLTAYTFTQDEWLLEKAIDLGNRLLPAFLTPTGLPRTSVNLKTGAAHSPKWSGGSSVLADVGSLQLEFAALSRLAKDEKYHIKAMDVFSYLRQKQPTDKLYPTMINPDTGEFTNGMISIGALGDSFYEYLLKYWLLTNKKATEIGAWYFETMDAVRTTLGKRYGADMYFMRIRQGHSSFEDTMDHLACYAGAVFSLGSTMMSDKQKATEHFEVGKGMGRFCYEMYRVNPSGLPCDSYRVDYKRTELSPVQSALGYVQRPEAVETWFYLWRLTKDPIYREWGWSFFEAIQNTKVEFGYSGVRDARAEPGKLSFDDEQQKDDVLPLDKFVFNTEAHPLQVFA